MNKILFHNGNILTMDYNNKSVESVVINDDKIIFCGDYKDSLKLIDESDEIINLKGRTLLPGFNDSHMHLLSYSMSKYKVNLIKCNSLNDIENQISEFINNEEIRVFKDWILGHGWNHENFKEKMLPSRWDIDKMIDDRPVFLSRACYHICVVNSKALELAGIDKYTKDPEGGRIDRDPITGEPTGILRENAIYMVYDLIPMTEDIDEIKELIKSGILDANKKGITSIQTDDFSHIKSYLNVIKAYKELKDNDELKARINLQMLLPNLDKLSDFLKLGIKSGDGDEILRFGPLKILADGSLGSRTAALNEPYSDDSSTDGVLIYKDYELQEILERAHSSGLQIAIHAIGDKTMNQILDIYRELLIKFPKKDPRFRIIHCQISSNEIFNKFRELNVIADIQPIFMKTDMHMAEKRVGQERMKTSYAWKTMMDMGIVLSGSSDAPIEPFDPILGVYSAVTRKDLKGNPKGGWYNDETISLNKALELYTKNSAYSTYEENIKGIIKKGMLADLVILSDNREKVNKDDLKDINIDMTILGGKIVYKK